MGIENLIIELKNYEIKNIGRNYQNLSNKVSREHLALFLEDDKLFISDISKNGTIAKTIKGQESDFNGIAVKIPLNELEYIKLDDEKITLIKIDNDKYIPQGKYFLKTKNADSINCVRMGKNADGYAQKIDESTIFGWKYHIYSYELHDYLNVLKTALPVLDDCGVAYKIVRPSLIDGLKEESKGRLITVYPLNADEFKKTSEELNNALLNNGLKLSENELKKNDSRIINDEKGFLIVKKDGKVKEKIVKFATNNSNRIFYRNELIVEKFGDRVKVSYDGGPEYPHIFNAGNAPNPFEKNDDENNKPVKNAVNKLGKKT
ncbi:MAG: FHA domain-containing protein [Candidatus Nanoarchaeia archaeon]|nr:FHA domain-containing protein [Candidatus Nanoarchaeia archaeon]MDD5053790.1 FHA domain-containing protein [Candidatus Nanoarchaeia archaeon]MDD5499901.1 FHA domain-containing protein [Candidatus Nanoarchaeia archaeon]